MQIDWFSFGIGAAAGWIAACIAWLWDYHVGWGLFAYRQSKSHHFMPKPNLPDELIRVYARRHWPGWKWQWTTVDDEGRPQVLVTRTVKKKQHWHLIKQREVKL